MLTHSVRKIAERKDLIQGLSILNKAFDLSDEWAISLKSPKPRSGLSISSTADLPPQTKARVRVGARLPYTPINPGASERLHSQPAAGMSTH